MRFAAIIAAAIAFLVALASVKVFAPPTYDRYVLRDPARPAPSRSSRAAAILILALLVLFALRFGLDLLHGSAHRSEAITVTPRGAEAHIQAWIALLCVSVAGISLCFFPVAIVTWLLRKRIVLSPTDAEATRKIRISGRVLGVVLLVVAAMIARQVV